MLLSLVPYLINFPFFKLVMVETITNSSERKASSETWVRPCRAFVRHAQQKICAHRLVAGDPSAPGGLHHCSAHSSLRLLTTATTIIIIKEIFRIRTREAGWGGEKHALDRGGKKGLILFIFVLLQSTEANTLRRMAHCPLRCKERASINWASVYDWTH